MSLRRAHRRAAALREVPAPPRPSDPWRTATVRACAAGLVAAVLAAAAAGALLAQVIPAPAALLAAIVLAGAAGAADARRIVMAVRDGARDRSERARAEGRPPLPAVRAAVRARGKMKVVRGKR